jgi:hypothetical protein
MLSLLLTILKDRLDHFAWHSCRALLRGTIRAECVPLVTAERFEKICALRSDPIALHYER